MAAPFFLPGMNMQQVHPCKRVAGQAYFPRPGVLETRCKLGAANRKHSKDSSLTNTALVVTILRQF